MHVDRFLLPCQADGDVNDQLQRVGMILTAYELSGGLGFEAAANEALFSAALDNALQPRPGIYTRYVGGDPANVSADQLIAALAAHVARRETKQIGWMALRCFARFGFAQNYKDGLDGTDRRKVPDFLLLRALPLFLRASRLLYPVAAVADLLLVFAALAAVGPVLRDDSFIPVRRTPDMVDDNSIILTLAVCRARMVTPLSWLAAKLYAKLRPYNHGCYEAIDQGYVEHSPVYGALRWYHRAEAGGNPEIAELWRPVVEKYLT